MGGPHATHWWCLTAGSNLLLLLKAKLRKEGSKLMSDGAHPRVANTYLPGRLVLLVFVEGWCPQC